MAFSPEEPLLLFTDFPPDFDGGGAVILRSLISPADRDRLLWVSLTAGTSSAEGRVVRLSTGQLGTSQWRSQLLDSTVFVRALSREILRVAAAHRVRALWLVLHGAGVPLAAELVRRSTLPLHLTVHDDPAFAVALRSRRYIALVP